MRRRLLAFLCEVPVVWSFLSLALGRILELVMLCCRSTEAKEIERRCCICCRQTRAARLGHCCIEPECAGEAQQSGGPLLPVRLDTR
jgi:hypothetical protein